MPNNMTITVKFSELPKPITITKQIVVIELLEGVVTVRVTLKPKHWIKLTAATTQFPLWVATLTGKIGKVSNNFIELIEPGLQIFEKKPKELPTES